MDWGAFEELVYDVESVTADLDAIVKAVPALREAELLICTGPFVLCGMLRQVLVLPMLVYLGLALTYMATASGLETLLATAWSTASLPGFHRGRLFTEASSESEGLIPSAVVVTDRVRAAQLHHAIGVWSAVVPPLSLYRFAHRDAQASLGGGRGGNERSALALRPELWRRASFGPALRGLLRRMAPPHVEFQGTHLSYSEILAFDAAIIIPWDNDVMSFYELYHAGMPVLVPSRALMTKWLPAVRWGSLEADGFNIQRHAGLAHDGGGEMPSAGDRPSLPGEVPWMDQRTLTAALAGGALGWIGASDYYRLPHVLQFGSVSSLVVELRSADLRAVSTSLREASEWLRGEALGFYRDLAARLLRRRDGDGSRHVGSRH